MQLLLLLILLGTSIESLKSLLPRVSALFRKYEYFGLVYVIDMNTHVLPFCLYYFVVPISLFWSIFRGFNKYSYYYYLFLLGPAYRLWHRFCHMWVRCFETTNTTVYCMSALLINMSYCSLYTISSFHSLRS